MSAKIAILDDHELLAQSLALSLQMRGFDVTPMEVAPLDEIQRRLTAEPPDVLLLDLQLGDAGHALPLVQPLTEAGVRVVVVSGVSDRCEIAATLDAGALGFVGKNNPLEVLVDAAVRAARGDHVTAPGAREQLLRELRERRVAEGAARAPFERLSDREQQVLHQLCAGHSVAAIAATWVVSIATVRSQVRAILTKIDVRSQLEAVALANSSGWFSGSREASGRS